MPTTTIQIIIIQPLIWAILGLEYPHGTGWGADDRVTSKDNKARDSLVWMRAFSITHVLLCHDQKSIAFLRSILEWF